jgi:CBS domain-containing protein
VDESTEKFRTENFPKFFSSVFFSLVSGVLTGPDSGRLPASSPEENGKLRGLLTDRDIALKITAEKRGPQVTKVREVMSTNLTTIPVNRTLHDLTIVMHTYHVRRIPIVDSEDKVLGLVTLDDLLILLG